MIDYEVNILFEQYIK